MLADLPFFDLPDGTLLADKESMKIDQVDLNQTRKSLITRLHDLDDRASWQEFFDTYWKLIYGVARKAELTDAEAQDVVQETMISVAKHMPGFKYNPAIGRFRSWLLKLVRWRITDQFRKRGPFVQPPPWAEETSTEVRPAVVEPAAQEFEALWDAEYNQALLEAALRNLKPRLDPQKYQIFDFNVNKGWSAEKVAERFGVPVHQVHLTKHRVMEKLTEELKRLDKDML